MVSLSTFYSQPPVTSACLCMVDIGSTTLIDVSLVRVSSIVCSISSTAVHELIKDLYQYGRHSG